MGNFNREAESSPLLIGTSGVLYGRQHEAESQFRKKAVEKWEIGVEQKGTVHAYRGPGVIWIAGRQVAEYAALSLDHQVVINGLYLAAVNKVVIAVADAAERIDLIINLDA